MSSPPPVHGADAESPVPVEETPTQDAAPSAEIHAPKSQGGSDKPSKADPANLRASMDILFTGCAGQADDSIVTIKHNWLPMVKDIVKHDTLVFVDTDWPVYKAHSRHQHFLPIVTRTTKGAVGYFLLTSETRGLSSGLKDYDYAVFKTKEAARGFFDTLTYPERKSVGNYQLKDMCMLHDNFCRILDVPTLPLAPTCDRYRLHGGRALTARLASAQLA